MNKKAKNVKLTNYATKKLSVRALLEWVNQSLAVKYVKIEELCTGAAYCQFMDKLFEKSIPMKCVKFRTNREREYIQNFQILESAFEEWKVDKIIPIESLATGRIKDNLEFLQWFKMFFDANYVDKEYNALAARGNIPMAIGMGSAGGGAGGGRGVVKSALTPPESSIASTSAASKTRPYEMSAVFTLAASAAASMGVPESTESLKTVIKNLKKENDALKKQIDALHKHIESLEEKIMRLEEKIMRLEAARGLSLQNTSYLRRTA